MGQRFLCALTSDARLWGQLHPRHRSARKVHIRGTTDGGPAAYAPDMRVDVVQQPDIGSAVRWLGTSTPCPRGGRRGRSNQPAVRIPVWSGSPDSSLCALGALSRSAAQLVQGVAQRLRRSAVRVRAFLLNLRAWGDQRYRWKCEARRRTCCGRSALGQTCAATCTPRRGVRRSHGMKGVGDRPASRGGTRDASWVRTGPV